MYQDEVGVDFPSNLYQTTISTLTMRQSFPLPLQAQKPIGCTRLVVELHILREHTTLKHLPDWTSSDKITPQRGAPKSWPVLPL